MSRAKMRRMRVAAEDAMNELDRRVTAASGQGGPLYERLSAEYLKAVDLHAEASDKEMREVLNPTEAAAGTKLTSATSKLEAEVARLKQSTARLTQLGNALTLGKEMVGLFKVVAG